MIRAILEKIEERYSGPKVDVLKKNAVALDDVAGQAGGSVIRLTSGAARVASRQFSRVRA